MTPENELILIPSLMLEKIIFTSAPASGESDAEKCWICCLISSPKKEAKERIIKRKGAIAIAE